MAIIKSVQFKRGNKDALEEKLIGDDKPKAGEPIWELDSNRLKIGNGVDNYASLKYLGEADKDDFVIDGYYYNGNFYKEAEHFNPLTKFKNKIYRDITIDEDGDPYNLLYYLRYDEVKGYSVFTEMVQMANARKYGLVKLYDSRTDANKNSTKGAPTMKLFTESIDAIKLGKEEAGEENILILEKPW